VGREENRTENIKQQKRLRKDERQLCSKIGVRERKGGLAATAGWKFCGPKRRGERGVSRPGKKAFAKRKRFNSGRHQTYRKL